MKVSEVERTLERAGRLLARASGSHRPFRHPSKPGLVTIAGNPS
jgi:predicted RNA binding protein YcfA (HicA-like mRNA interferase family)